MGRIVDPRESLRRSSLKMAELWQTFLHHALEAMATTHGQERLLRDTLICGHHNLTNCARRLRKNPGWGMTGTMRDDTINLHAEMQEAHRFYMNNRPKFHKDDTSFIAKAFDLMDGLMNQQVRLAREIQELHDTGAIEIAVTTDRHTAQLIKEPKFTEEMHN